MSETKEDIISFNPFYGKIELRSWFEFDGKKCIGMGSKIIRDKDGGILEAKIEPTGVVLHMDSTKL